MACFSDKGGKEVEEQMTKRYSPDKTTWPKIGCGTKFRPWARGASKLLEIETSHGWVNIIADRLPEQLDDEIKKVQYEFCKCCNKVTAEDILASVPIAFPRLNVLSHVVGVAQFPLDDWKAAGQPTLTEAGWMALVQVIAKKNPNLKQLIELTRSHSGPVAVRTPPS